MSNLKLKECLKKTLGDNISFNEDKNFQMMNISINDFFFFFRYDQKDFYFHKGVNLLRLSSIYLIKKILIFYTDIMYIIKHVLSHFLKITSTTISILAM